jgi:hypothetical protein
MAAERTTRISVTSFLAKLGPHFLQKGCVSRTGILLECHPCADFKQFLIEESGNLAQPGAILRPVFESGTRFKSWSRELRRATPYQVRLSFETESFLWRLTDTYPLDIHSLMRCWNFQGPSAILS